MKLDRALDHLMCADVVAKGGSIYAVGRAEPAGVDIQNPGREGHPLLNDYLPALIEAITTTRDTIKAMVKRL